MSAKLDPGVYSIGAVAEMTGVPASTLRYWERAYGLIVPTRSPGGHRLYSPEAVRHIVWLKNAIEDRGLRAGAAHALLLAQHEHLGDYEATTLERATALRELLELTTSSLAPREIADLAVRFFVERLDVDAISLWQFDEPRDRLILETSAGLPLEMFEDFSQGVGTGEDYAISVAFSQRRPVAFSDAPGSPRLPDRVRDTYARYGVPIGAVLALPVGAKSPHAIGAITLAWREPRPVSEGDIAFLSAAVNALAIAMENARLFEAEAEARRSADAQLERTALLLEAANSLADASELGPALHRLAKILLQAVPHTRAVVYRLDDQTDEFEVLAALGDRVPGVGARLPLTSMTLRAREILATGRAQVIDFDAMDEAQRGQGERFGVHLLLATPLTHRESVLGIIVLDDPDEPRRPFSATDIEIVEAFAAQAAAAMENARLLRAERDSARLAEARAEVDNVVLSSLDFDEIAAGALAEGAKAIGAETGAIIGRDGDGWLTWSSYNFTPSVVGVRLTDAENPHGVVAVTTRKPVAIDDAYTDPRVDNEFMKGYGLRSVVVAPLLLRGEAVAGLYYNYNSSIHHFAREEIQFVAKVAASLSLALEKARLVDDLRSTSDRVTTILGSIGDAFFALDHEWRFTYVNREAERLLRAGSQELVGANIWSVFPDAVDAAYHREYQRAMNERVSVSFEEYYPAFDLWTEVRAYPAADGISVYFRDIGDRRRAEAALAESRERGDILAKLLDESSQPFMAGLPDGTMLLFNPAFQELTGRSGAQLQAATWPDDLTVPEDVDRERALLVEVARTRIPARYEKEMLRPDGTRVPVEVLRHADFDEDGDVRYFYAFFTDITERREAERLNTALNAIGAAVSATLDRERILDLALEQATVVLGAESGALATREPGGWLIRRTAGAPLGLEGRRLAEIGIEPRALSRDEHGPTVIDDTEAEDGATAKVLRALGIRSTLALPILAGGAPVGYAAFLHSRRRVTFSRAQKEFATRLMSIVTLALENARVYEQQRHIANTLQQAVLAPPEDVEGIEVAYLYRAASSTADVGGDYYDVFQLDDARVGIVIGDVSGKGVGAARLTSLMRDGLRAYAYLNADPLWILGHTNRLVQRSTPTEEFSTVFLSVLDLGTGRLVYSGAAHPPAAILRADGATQSLASRGTLLGAFENARFAVDSTTLEYGDVLVLCTDGVTEARRGVELFGDERLLESVGALHGTPLADLPQALLDRVLEYSGGALRDDCVILCVSRTPGR